MSNNKKKILPLILVCAGCIAAHAQEYVYSLDELYSLADEKNKSIRIYTTAKRAADDAVVSAKAQRLPDISAQLALSYNGRGIITDRDFSNPMNIYIPEYGNNLAVRASQVIYSGGAISGSIKLGELGRQMAEFDLQSNRQDVRFIITGRYLDIYRSLNALKVIEQNIALAEKELNNMRDRYEQGTALRNDITRYELQLEMLRLQRARTEDSYRTLNYRLCKDVGLPDGTLIRPDTTLSVRNITLQDEPYWQQAAADNYNLRRMETAMRMAEVRLHVERSASMPHFSMFAENFLTGPVTIEVPALNKNFNYWYVGVSVRYDISSLFKNGHNIHRAQHETVKAGEEYEAAREQTDVSVQAAYTEMCTSLTELRTQEKSVQLAAENYQVVSNRYDNGLAIITDLLDAANMKLSADLKLVDAEIDMAYCRYRLRYLAHSL